MSQLDYQPMSGGVPVDPAPTGGGVQLLELFTDEDYTGTPISISPPVVVAAGVYRFTINDSSTPAGRYWPRVHWTAAAAGPTQLDDLPDPLDLPVRADLVVSPETLADELGIPLPLEREQRRELIRALHAGQDAVVAHLGREIVPQIITERRPQSPAGLQLLSEQPVHALISEVEELDAVTGWPTGYWTVTYRGGLDARSDARLRPIRRAVLVAAANSDAGLRLWRTAGAGAASDGTGARRVRSVSAEGQSVSYEDTRPGGATGSSSSGLVGEPMSWELIDRWRLRGRRVFSRRGTPGVRADVGIIRIGL